MASPRPDRTPLVPAGGRFTGTIAFRGDAIVDGEVDGPVEGEGKLHVGATGRIRGDVDVDELHLAGEVEGAVRGRLRVSIDGGATLRGTLATQLLEVADGAVLEGPCRVGDASEKAGSAPAKTPR